MEQLDINTILNRNEQGKNLYNSLDIFEHNKKDMLVRRVFTSMVHQVVEKRAL